MSAAWAAVAACIDHTNLSPLAGSGEISRLCAEAVAQGFASVCVLPSALPQAVAELRGTAVVPGTVIGFPLGGNAIQLKAAEAAWAREKGAEELDMVINLAALKSGDHDYLAAEIAAVHEAAPGARLKVIIETCYLTEEEKIIAALLAKQNGAAFVKTSSGFAPQGATIADVALLRSTVGADFGVKAAGGIRDRYTVEAMLEAGANRIGTSSALAIQAEYQAATQAE